MTKEGSAISTNPLPVRSALDVLQLEFPRYRITMQTIWGKLFYVAEATQPSVQPRYAQAESTERLRARLQVPVKPFRPAEPSIARVWDFLLGGKDNFAPDRAQAKKMLNVFPRAAELARESRQFQARAVTYAGGRGIRQFLDIGCGLPTAPSTHETAQNAQPGAVVVYADNDEQVLTHAQNILAKTENVHTMAGDLTFPDELMYDWRVRHWMDFYQPMCLVLAMTLHFWPPDQARKITARLIGAMPYGSYLIVSAGQLEGETGTKFTSEYSAGRLYHHDRDTIASFLDGLELADPGVTEARAWQAPAAIPGNGRRGHIWAAAGRKTADAGPP